MITNGRLHSRVILAASKAEIAKAGKQAKLLVWAAETAADKGMPQATMMEGSRSQCLRE